MAEKLVVIWIMVTPGGQINIFWPKTTKKIGITLINSKFWPIDDT